MAKPNPEAIWTLKKKPRRDPKFHIAEMLLGQGNSIIDEWTIFKSLFEEIKETIGFKP